ncbi:EAL domain-containing protein [Vibrio rotiferianus]|uniref:EAL domain-containing protein n=1 Tax=Vibrio rotiferianus TaxID=190895 RepID=UPI00406A34AE
MKELTFFFQPKLEKVEQDKYVTYGYEALLRTQTSDGQFVLPSEILSLNKDDYYFDLFLLDLLKETIESTNHFKDKNISINIHPTFLEKFDHSDLNKLVDFNCKSLEFEILESSIISKFDDFNDNFAKVNEKTNVSLTLDDFGKGYTSLERIFFLKNIHTLKLDRLMTYDLLNNETKRKFISWIICFFKEELKVDIVAEGIQDLLVLKMLNEMGINKYQGYLFSKAKSIQEICSEQEVIFDSEYFKHHSVRF